jgi:acetyl esterase/lipase
VDSNVVYGMYSGAALLLDVHHPTKPNGFGVVFIPGSGWTAPLGYSAPPLKQSEQVAMYVPSLTEAGYTVFAITHRATPSFRYPAQLEDAERAVRFVRANAAKYGIDPARIGGAGDRPARIS